MILEEEKTTNKDFGRDGKPSLPILFFYKNGGIYTMRIINNVDCLTCENREFCKYMRHMDNIQNDINILANSVTVESDNLELILSCKHCRKIPSISLRGVNETGQTCQTGVAYLNTSNSASSECSIARGECSVPPAERVYDLNSDVERSSDKISAGDFLTNIINTCKETR